MIVLSNYPNDPRVRREAEALVNNGYCVDIVCLQSKNELAEEHYDGIRVFRIYESKSKESIGQYILLTFNFFWKTFRFINKLSRENQYSVIQIHNMPDYLVFAAVLQKMRGVPIILDLHDIMKELFKSRWNDGIKKLMLPIVGFTEKLSWLYADALITTSHGFKRCLLKRGVDEEKITLIFNTADQKIFNQPKTNWFYKRENPKLLYHGTVAERFGIHIAIVAVNLLKQKYPRIRFDIYGNYQEGYRRKLEKIINENSLEENVFLHGYVSLEEIRTIIQNSDFGIVPYISDSFMDLALSTKTFEYVAMKLPVIASDLPSMRSIFSDEQLYYFKQENPQHLAEVMSEIFCDGVVLKKKVINAAKVYELINWHLMTREYISLIEKLSRKN